MRKITLKFQHPSTDIFKNINVLNLEIKLCANKKAKRDIKQLDNNLKECRIN